MSKIEKEGFPFGENWLDFLRILSDEHILEAEKALRTFLGDVNWKDKRFLDIGSGSGLHSLAARKLGAEVFSFDHDLQCVACTRELRSRYFPNDQLWNIEQGSILDREFVDGLGDFDISYAWGVLHHTGVLWQALYNAQRPVCENGLLLVAIYNDQGIISALWKIVKRLYCSGWLGRALMSAVFYPVFFLSGLLIDVIRLRNPATRYREHKKYRGMSLLHDWCDWLGGYPFEVAKPSQIISFYENLGFELIQFLPTGHGFGNNQFLFRKVNRLS
jgi:SAM-dependent methyltransferase